VEVPLSEAFAIAESFRRTIGEMKIQANKTVVEVTSSFGVAEWEIGDTADSLLRRADLALYEAKRAGRNRVVASDTFSNSRNHEQSRGIFPTSTLR
jgi:diguanylate cyclase (GGDEF)-like protein